MSVAAAGAGGDGANEADQILILALRQAGCAIPPDVQSPKQFTSELVVACAAQSLAAITQGEANFPTTLPASVAQRHRICQQLGNKMKELGYTGESGYNQFLYPNERDVRKMLMWLVERLPKAEDEASAEPMGAAAKLDRALATRLRSWATELWRPHTLGAAPGTAAALPLLPPPARTRVARRSLRAGRLSVPWEAVAGASVPAPRLAYFNTLLAPAAEQVAHPLELAPALLEELARQQALAAEREHAWDQGGSALDSVAERRQQQRSQVLGTLRTGLAQAASAAAAARARAGGLSLGELVAKMGMDAASAAVTRQKESMFSHAQKFAQESATPVVPAPLAAPDTAAAEVAGAGTGEAAAAEAPEAPRESAAERARRLEQEERERQEREVEEMQRRLAEAAARREAAEQHREHSLASMRQAEAALGEQRARTAELERGYAVKRKTVEMLPDAEANLRNLQGACAGNAQKLMELAAEWERHRRPLVDAIRVQKQAAITRREECRFKVQEMRRMREELRTMAPSMREQEERCKALAAELERMPASVNRAVYTYRILDIIKQVHKQKAEIRRIIEDIRSVQKDINSVSETLHRTEALADELVYSVASDKRNDPSYVEAYRGLTDLRQCFEGLVETVRDIGRVENSIRDTNTRAEQLAARTSSQNVKRIQQDLKEVRAENERMATQLRDAR